MHWSAETGSARWLSRIQRFRSLSPLCEHPECTGCGLDKVRAGRQPPNINVGQVDADRGRMSEDHAMDVGISEMASKRSTYPPGPPFRRYTSIVRPDSMQTSF